MSVIPLTPARFDLYAQAVNVATEGHPAGREVSDALGGIVDATEDQSGRILVLDARSRIALFDRQLRLLRIIAQQSNGSMLFREAAAIGALADGRIAVLDRARLRIYLMRIPSQAAAPLEVDSVELDTSAENMCALQNNTFLIYGLGQGRRLHIFSKQGRRLRSFAPADTTLSQMAQDQLTMGRIACDEALDEVIVTSAFLPVVEGFRISTGHRVWVDTLRPYRGVEIMYRGNAMGLRTAASGHSYVSSIHYLNRCRLLQATYVGRHDEGADTVVSYLYQPATNRWQPARLDHPLILPLKRGKAVTPPSANQPLQLRRVSPSGCG